MSIKSVNMKISKNKKMRFFLMSQGSFNPKISFLGQKVCSVARLHTDRQTDTQTEWLLRTPFQGFMIFSFSLSSRIGPKCISFSCFKDHSTPQKIGSQVKRCALQPANRQIHRHTHIHESEYRGHPFRVSGIFPSTYHQGSK